MCDPLEDYLGSVKNGERNITNLRYTDDIVLICQFSTGLRSSRNISEVRANTKLNTEEN